jgi:hypothetical protein
VEDQDKATKVRLKAEFGEGNVIFATVKRFGLMAFRKPTEEQYLDYSGSIGAPMESSMVACEQFAFDCMAHPVEAEAKAKARRLFKAMPLLASNTASAICAMSCGDYDPLELTDDEKKALDERWEFGWGGLKPAGLAPIVMATDQTAGTIARIAFDAQQNGDTDNGRKIRAAVLALTRSPDNTTMEGIISQRPALLRPLWYRAQELVGAGVAEVGKD